MSLVTKKQAVDALMDAGIDAMERDDQCVAITLFGAAEEAMPRAEVTTFFEMLRDAFAAYFENDTKRSATALNEVAIGSSIQEVLKN